MIRHLLAVVVLAGLVIPFGGGCSDKSKSGEPKVQSPAKDKAPAPLGAPNIGGGGNQPQKGAGGKPE